MAPAHWVWSGSAQVVDALRANGLEFGSFDILTDEANRQGVKEYSSWPTYPQLYVKGELVGGCDIILEMQVRVSSVQQLGAGHTVADAAGERCPLSHTPPFFLSCLPSLSPRDGQESGELKTTIEEMLYRTADA